MEPKDKPMIKDKLTQKCRMAVLVLFMIYTALVSVCFVVASHKLTLAREALQSYETQPK